MLWVHLPLSHHSQAKVLVGTGLGLGLPEEAAGVQEEEFLSKNLSAGPPGTQHCQHRTEQWQGWDRALV